jgi:MFS family permease
VVAETTKRKVGVTLKSTVRALRHRNFRLFFTGQGISLIGTWMQRVALGWLVYQLTHSAFLLGIVAFSGQIPNLILAPFAGVVADRWNRHSQLLWTQSLAMLQAFALAFLVATGLIRIWHIIALSVLLGAINAFDTPIRQAFLVDMVEGREDLGNAIALNSSMVNGARLLGPSAAGLLIGAVGEGACFLMNGISYLAVIGSLLLMRLRQEPEKPHKARVWHQLGEGIRYASKSGPIRAILMMLALVSFMGMPYSALMPIFAKDILHGGAQALGFLMGAAGVGALVGAAYLASRRTVLGLGRMIPLAALVFGAGLIGFSFSRVFAVSMALMLLTGFGQMVQLAASNTLLQTIVDDDKRGRVMSLYAMSFMGMMPLGNLIAGAVAGRIGAPWTVRLGGVVCIAGAAVFAGRLPALRRLARPIYVSKGIIPEIVSGIQSATESSSITSRPPGPSSGTS